MTLTNRESQRLRDALNLIANELEAGAPVTNDADETLTAIRRWTKALLAAGVGIAACAVVAALWTSRDSETDPGPDQSDDAAQAQAQSPGEYWACAETIVEGQVTEVSPASGRHVQVVVTTTRWIKPSSGPATVRLSFVDPATQGRSAIRPGHYLLSVPANRYVAPDAFGSEDIPDTLRVIEEGREQARVEGITTCPLYWRELRP